jgi:hypothetical protein
MRYFQGLNYESINNGDKPLFYWILYVNEPISLVGRSLEDNQLYEKGLLHVSVGSFRGYLR